MRAQARQPNPENAIHLSDTGPFLLDVEDGELLSQRQILKGEFATIAEEILRQHQCHP